jgi:UDP-sugar transporter A1/2/3
MYFPSVAVFWMEIIKLSICLFLVLQVDCAGHIFEYFLNILILLCRNNFSAIKLIRSEVIDQPMNTLKVGVPAILYIIQNNLLYIAASHLDAATSTVQYFKREYCI